MKPLGIHLKIISVLFVFSILTACGGGSSDESDSKKVEGVSIVASKIEFTSYQNIWTIPEWQKINVHWSNPDIAVVLVGYPTGSIPVSWLNMRFDSIAKTLNVGVNTTWLTSGIHSAVVRVASADINGDLINYVDIPLTYTILPGVSISYANMSFKTYEGLFPSAETIELAYTGDETVPWNSYMSYHSSCRNGWLDFSRNSGASAPATFSIVPNKSTITDARGCSASLYIDYQLGGKTVNNSFLITYEVLTAWGTVTPSSLDFVIDAQSTVDSLTRSVIVQDNYPGSEAINWSASTDAEWLSISTPNGDSDTSNTVTISILESHLGSAATRAGATITLTSSNPNIAVKTIPVSVTYNVPTLSNVSPGVQFVGKPAKVIVRGTGFNSVNIADITVGAITAAQVDVISDTEMHVTADASIFNIAGSYPVNVTSSNLLNFSQAELTIVNPPAYTQDEITLAEHALKIVHDPERNAIFYIEDFGGTRLVKQQYSPNSGWVKSSLELPGLLALQNTVDRSEILVTTRLGYTVHHIDPDTLALNKSVPFLTNQSYLYLGHINPMNDGRIIISTTSGYKQSFSYPNSESVNLGNVDSSVQLLSENRDILINGPSSSSTGNNLMYTYDASGGPLSSFGVVDVHPSTSSISHWGERIVFWNRVYNSTYTYLGDLDGASALGFGPLVVSPNGNRVYTVKSGVITTYDISGTTGPFTTIGIPIPIPVGSLGDSVYASKVYISQDGSTLFVSCHVIPQFNFPEYYRLVVVPLP